jgi:hypothetical protein
MKIAGEICIYTNDHVTIEELKASGYIRLPLDPWPFTCPHPPKNKSSRSTS